MTLAWKVSLEWMHAFCAGFTKLCEIAKCVTASHCAGLNERAQCVTDPFVAKCEHKGDQ